MENSGFIYKYCVNKHCYYGYTNNVKRRFDQHKKYIENVYEENINGDGDFINFISGDILKYDIRYYKTFSIMLFENQKPDDIKYEVIMECKKFNNGGMFEKEFAKRGLINGVDKNIMLDTKESFFEAYKTREEIYEIYKLEMEKRWK